MGGVASIYFYFGRRAPGSDLHVHTLAFGPSDNPSSRCRSSPFDSLSICDMAYGRGGLNDRQYASWAVMSTSTVG